MKRIIIFGLLALSACGMPMGEASDDLDAAVERADLVKACASGVDVGLDPVTHRLIATKWSGRAWVAKGLTADQVCGKAQ